MVMSTARLTLIGGPTALVEFGGFRLLTDPTFDDPGEYRLPHTTLTTSERSTPYCSVTTSMPTISIGPVAIS
jgi:L-ascorbate metabolism protein UlaG (beta-lactamase superfamily)